jgi:hypothetical protein
MYCSICKYDVVCLCVFRNAPFIQITLFTAVHSLHVGWRNFFSSCAVSCGSFWFWREIGFGFTYITYVLRVQYSCGVVLVFWIWREIVFGVTYVLSVQ